MEQVTQNVFTETKVRGCNPSYVTTADGVVVVDTPQLPTRAVQMREEAERHGPIRYVINTEHHVDHIFGNYYFKGAGPVVSHIGVRDNFMVVSPELNPYEYAKEAIPADDPEGADIFPDEETYFADPNRPAITFEGKELTIRVGGHTFNLIHAPGHTPGQVAVHVPEERVVFTGDTIFSECQTWHYTSDIPQWIDSLDLIDQRVAVDHVVPGHGPVTTQDYLRVQKSFLYEWLAAVSVAVAQGWSKEEALKRIDFRDRFPVDIGQEYMMDHIQENNISALYDKLAAGSASG